MRTVGLAVVLALGLAGGSSAEIVAPGIQDGMLAIAPNGTPLVAYVRGTSLEIATRNSNGSWRTARAGTVARGSSLAAFAAGKDGPTALVQGAGERTLALIRRRTHGWRRTPLVRSLPAGVVLGWPGLVLDRRGLPVVAYTRWRPATRKSALQLVRLDVRDRIHTEQVTSEGFPRSHVAPPAAPVLTGGATHVIEGYGADGSVGTIEWSRQHGTWGGQFIDAGIGDFPVGPLLAAVSSTGTVYAAWSEALLGTGEMPVSLAVHGRSIESNFVLDRAVTTGLAATPSGPEVAANEWVTAGELGLPGDGVVWAGELAGHGRRVGLDGWIADLAVTPGGARDFLLGRSGGLSWFRSRRPLAVRVSIGATAGTNGGVVVAGHVRGASGGTVTVYRERPGSARETVGRVALAPNGSFSLFDRPPVRPLLYRAVYTAPATGIPYAALLRDPVR